MSDTPLFDPLDYLPTIVADRTEKEQYIDAIARDMQTLRMGPDYWHPSKEFYLERIEAYKEAIRELDE